MGIGFKRFLALSCLIGMSHASAENGVTDDAIVLGQSAALSGPQAENGMHYAHGIKLYFDQINARGGINGRKIWIQALDDAYDPERAVANTRKLVDEERVFALIGYSGTGSTLATLPIVEKAQVPLFAPHSGADALRSNENRMLFVVRAGYRDEMERMVRHLVTTGVRRIAVAYQDDNFGRAALRAAEDALARLEVRATAVGAVDGRTYDAKRAVEAIAAARPDAILMGTAGQASVAFIRAYLSTGEQPQFYGLSVMSAGQLHKELGRDGGGIIVAQVVPSPWSGKYAVVRQYREALGKDGTREPHHSSLEGWIVAKALAEGIRRAGQSPTREKLITALESMHNVDLGDFVIDFSSDKRTGSTFIDLSITSSSARFVQ